MPRYTPLRLFILSAITVFLAGCAVSAPVRVASLALDGLSYVFTEKSIIDNSLSLATGQDCVAFRLISKGSACQNYAETGIDFNANLTSKVSTDTSICNIPQISRDLPNKVRLDQCAVRLVDKLGEGGALNYVDQRIEQHVKAWESEYAGLWIAIQLSVRKASGDEARVVWR